jgi:hypothetical protein
MIDVDAGQSTNPLAPALWFLVAQAGHLGCDGWTFDRRDGRLRCACGAALYEFHEMDRHRGGPAASPAGPARKAATDDPG